jgi:hypothetical protein
MSNSLLQVGIPVLVAADGAADVAMGSSHTKQRRWGEATTSPTQREQGELRSRQHWASQLMLPEWLIEVPQDLATNWWVWGVGGAGSSVSKAPTATSALPRHLASCTSLPNMPANARMRAIAVRLRLRHAGTSSPARRACAASSYLAGALRWLACERAPRWNALPRSCRQGRRAPQEPITAYWTVCSTSRTGRTTF